MECFSSLLAGFTLSPRIPALTWLVLAYALNSTNNCDQVPTLLWLCPFEKHIYRRRNYIQRTKTNKQTQNKVAKDTVNITRPKSLLKRVFSLFYTNPLFHLVLPKKVDRFLRKKVQHWLKNPFSSSYYMLLASSNTSTKIKSILQKNGRCKW